MSKLKASSSLQDNVFTNDYPKRIIIEVITGEDNDTIIVNRTVENLSAFETYGLLTAVRQAVAEQMAFPATQRSDGITVTRTKEIKNG